MKLTQKVTIKGYDGKLPIYLVDELAEQTGGKKACNLYIALAALDEKHKIIGESPLIIVVSKKFLRFARRNQLALLTYYNELPEQEQYDFFTQKGPEMAAKTEVVAVYGKHRFNAAFRKLERKERKSIRKCTGGLHREYKKTLKDEKKLMKNLGGFSELVGDDATEAIDLVDYFQKSGGGAVEISSYKGAKLTAPNVGVAIPIESTTTENYGDDIVEDVVVTPEDETVEVSATAQEVVSPA